MPAKAFTHITCREPNVDKLDVKLLGTLLKRGSVVRQRFPPDSVFLKLSKHVQ